MHRYDDEGRTDGLKRLIAGQDIPSWRVPKGKKGGLVCDRTVVGADAWVDAESTVHASTIVRGTLVRNSDISASSISGGVIQSSTVHDSFLWHASCDQAYVLRSILYSSSVTLDTSFAPKPLARNDHAGPPNVEYSVLMAAEISGKSSVWQSSVNGARIYASVISSSTFGGSEAHHATVSDSSVERSYLSHRVVREARVARLPKDAQFGQLRFPDRSTLDRSAELSGGHFGDFPAQIDIWPKLPGRIRQIAFLSWIVGVPWAFWTTPLLSVIIAMPLPALVGLRLASGLASNIVGKLEARSIAKKTPGKIRSSVATALKSCGAAFASLKKLLNGLLLAGTVLVPTAIVSGAVVERVLNVDGEPPRSTEVVDSARLETGSDTDRFDRGASSSTASSEVSVPTPLPVTSSNLRAVAYDREHSYLYVWFHSGDLYRYDNVSESVYRSLLTASSKGRYHASYIRDQYTSVRLS